MKKRLILLVTPLLMWVTSAQAGGLIIEPFVGYTVSGEFDAETDLNGKGSITGPSLGARVGYGLLGFTFGLEYITNLEREIDNDVAGVEDFDFESTGLGVYAAFDFPILLRVYAGYSFWYEGSTTGNTSGVKTDLEDGSGLTLGVGYTGLPFVSINLEYRTYSFDTAVQNGVESNLSTADADQIMLGVSLPLDIPFL